MAVPLGQEVVVKETQFLRRQESQTMKKIKQITSFVLMLVSALAFSQETLSDLLKKHNNNDIPYISVTELRMLQLNKDVLILDSREMKECNVSRIPNASFVGYDFFSIEDFQNKHPNKEEEIVVYCSLGIRSETTAIQLKKAGYSKVKNLYGGIFEWKNKGYPVLDSTNIITENVHTFNEEWSKWLREGVKIYD